MIRTVLRTYPSVATLDDLGRVQGSTHPLNYDVVLGPEYRYDTKTKAMRPHAGRPVDHGTPRG